MGGLVGGGPASYSYGGNPSAYIPGGQPQADQAYQQLISQLSSNYLPQAGQATQSGISAAGTIQQQYSPQMLMSGMGNAQQLSGLVPQIIGSAFDPQNALYNSKVNDLTQGANAANAASGVAGPYAASVTDDALSNFANQWQNQQLGRQTQGTAAAAGAGSAGQGLYGQTAQNYLGTQGGLANSAIGQLEGLYQPLFGATNNYLGLGQQADMLGLQGGQMGVNQQYQGLAGLGMLPTLLGGAAFGAGGGGLLGGLAGLLGGGVGGSSDMDLLAASPYL